MLSIRKATDLDAREICALHTKSIRELCSTRYSPDQIAAWTAPLTPGQYKPAMHEFEFFVAEEEQVLGFLILDLQGAEVNAIYVHPEAVERGIGSRLYEFAEELARDGSISELKLMSTLNAVGFYEACGFRRVRESVHTSSTGLELPCVEMRKKLEPA